MMTTKEQYLWYNDIVEAYSKAYMKINRDDVLEFTRELVEEWIVDSEGLKDVYYNLFVKKW